MSAAPRTGEMSERLYSVGELARELGITPRALRFYEDRGLVAPRRIGRHRVYTHRDRARLQLVLRGKRLGFSLREIAEWLALYDADPAQLRQTRYLLERVWRRIAELERQRRDIETTLEELRAIERQARDHLRRVAPGLAGGRMALHPRPVRDPEP